MDVISTSRIVTSAQKSYATGSIGYNIKVIAATKLGGQKTRRSKKSGPESESRSLRPRCQDLS